MGAMTRHGTVRRLLIACVTATLVLGSVGVQLVAAASVTFGTASASSTFGKSLTFRQSVEVGSSAVTRTEILLLFPGALGPALIEVPQAKPLDAGSQRLTYTWDTVKDGHIVPNTVIGATWRVTTADGAVAESPALSYRYRDDGFDWQTKQGDLVTIYWYEGGASFGTRALAIAEQGVTNAEKLLGVTEKDPIDFYVYADQNAFYAALGPGTPENVGGEAHADIRTMFALITPDEVNQSWVQNVVPHELTHLVFNTAVDNPYHFPPKWLNEGLAVYLAQGYVSSDRDSVESAGADGTLAPLASLSGGFPNGDRFFLAYAESVSAIDYMVKTYGKPDLVKLIRSYAKGLTDDEAFTAALGVDTKTFDAGWRTSVGAKPMASTGPQPAPAGPLPSDWTGTAPGSSPAAPGTSVSALPSSFAPDVSAPPAAPANPTDGGASGAAGYIIPLGALFLLVVVVVAVAIASRKRASPGEPPG
jgi:hypothetical protein